MTKSIKILSALLGIILLMSVLSIPAYASEEYEIVIDSMSVTKTGYGEIIGHISGVPLDTQISCIIAKSEMFDADGNIIDAEVNMNNLAWIDQIGTGNNGTFLIQFTVNSKFSESTLEVRMGCQYTQMFSGQIEIPELPAGIEIAANNSALYGRDIYYVAGGLYIAESIANSIAYGGNNVYFKIGDYWYDLMDDEAVDNSFLVKENAVKDAQIESLKPRYYYSVTEQIKLKYVE